MPIELFTNEDTPVTVGLIVDASGSMRPKLADLITAAMAFARSSNPQDELFAIRFNDDVQHVIPGRPFLLANDVADFETAMRAVRADGQTALYDGVMAGLDHLKNGARARKVLVVVSDGGDNVSDATLDAVLARARGSNAAIYTIGLYDADDLDRNPRVLKSLAQTTGGERFEPRTAARSAGGLRADRARDPQRLHHRLRAAVARRRLSPDQGGHRAVRGARAQRPHAPGLFRRGTGAEAMSSRICY